MTRSKYMNKYVFSESGAVNVDWVVLTAALVGLAVSVIAYVSTGTLDLAEKLEEDLIATE